jgi:hypothetical protein
LVSSARFIHRKGATSMLRHPLRAAIVLAALATVLVLPGSAFAAKTEHTTFDETFPENICGIDVTTHVEGVFNGFQYSTQGGFPLFKGTFHQTVTWTAANGKFVVASSDGMSKDFQVVDNGNGTITVYTALDGQPNVLRTATGQALVRARGRLVVATVLDYNGTPGNDEDDIFISDEIVFNAGSHPFAEGTVNGCDLIIPALT